MFAKGRGNSFEIQFNFFNTEGIKRRQAPICMIILIEPDIIPQNLILIWGIYARFLSLLGVVVICDRYINDTLLDFRRNFPKSDIENTVYWYFLKSILVLSVLSLLDGVCSVNHHLKKYHRCLERTNL